MSADEKTQMSNIECLKGTIILIILIAIAFALMDITQGWSVIILFIGFWILICANGLL